VVRQAVDYLKSIGAYAEITHGRKTKLVPTDYGKLLSALPFAVADSRTILLAAQHSYLHEALALWRILHRRPYPIVHHFGANEKNEKTLQMYYSNVDPKDPKPVALANL